MPTLREPKVIIAGVQNIEVPADLLKAARGPLFSRADTRFIVIALLSVLIHAGLVFYVNTTRLKVAEPKKLEDVSERFVKLIIEKPLPKLEKTVKREKAVQGEGSGPALAEESPSTQTGASEPAASKFSEAQRSAAKKSVAAQTARTESRIRTVGVLGMLTGTGTTAKGPAVVDILGSMGAKREQHQDLEKALENMSGLQKAGDVEVTEKKLVRSKEIITGQRGGNERIDDLIAGIGSVKATEISKRGDIVIQRPESIQGAASSNAKRDNDAINKVVVERKSSIRMTYEKYLKRDPGLAGKITVRFTILASGEVTRIEVLENSTGNTDLESEITRKIALWTFEAISEGEVTVTYPFIFKPGA